MRRQDSGPFGGGGGKGPGRRFGGGLLASVLIPEVFGSWRLIQPGLRDCAGPACRLSTARPQTPACGAQHASPEESKPQPETRPAHLSGSLSPNGATAELGDQPSCSETPRSAHLSSARQSLTGTLAGDTPRPWERSRQKHKRDRTSQQERWLWSGPGGTSQEARTPMERTGGALHLQDRPGAESVQQKVGPPDTPRGKGRGGRGLGTTPGATPASAGPPWVPTPSGSRGTSRHARVTYLLGQPPRPARPGRLCSCRPCWHLLTWERKQAGEREREQAAPRRARPAPGPRTGSRHSWGGPWTGLSYGPC